MTPLIVEGKTLLAVKCIPKFECTDCACGNKRGGGDKCVRIHPKTKELYFESLQGNDRNGLLYCINATEHDLVFINDTPEDIARYVAARLENT
jgi:hypothetical protein